MSIVISIVGICLIIVLLSFGNPGDRFSILLNRDFLKAFGLFAVQTGLAAIIGGGMGAILAGLIQRSDKLFEPVTRLLRLGPFLVLWALPGWKAPRVFQADVAASETLVVGTIIVVPLIFISSVYFRLRSMYGRLALRWLLSKPCHLPLWEWFSARCLAAPEVSLLYWLSRVRHRW
jgi:hypothetical protein